ncbi:hypothetical protein Esti_006315 [Eimeria stiedai]
MGTLQLTAVVRWKHASARQSSFRPRGLPLILKSAGFPAFPGTAFSSFTHSESNLPACGGEESEAAEAPTADTASSPPTPTGAGLPTALLAELSEVTAAKLLSGRRLQRLAAAAAAQGIRDPRVWAALSTRAMELNRSVERGSLRAAHKGDDAPETSSSDARGFRHFEALQFLSSFLSAGFKDTDLLISFEPIFLRQLHAFDCRHLIQLLHICEQHNHRARGLYTPLFKTLTAQAPLFLFQEITDLFCCFAVHRVGSSSCCAGLLRAAMAQVPNSTLSDCMRFCGALNALGLAPQGEQADQKPGATSGTLSLAEEAAATVLSLVQQRVGFLVDGLPLQLLIDEVQGLPRLEFSWRPYEELAKTTLLRRLGELPHADDVDQLADPFATLQFLRAQGSLQEPFLKAMIRWCAAAAHRPATRSQKRPTAEELVLLHDACREFGMADDERLQKAILKFVSTKGGTARNKRFVSPLEYQRNRRYFYLPDLRAGCRPATS